ncbi:glycogen debranching N-terminal domain-containing protein [Pseudochelatococcus sp. G4_1912]|uniref:amylo-alpha-1,6-glucosidase n=1 Tax=Pseudochelatococcus sp. G4_1912 TaxID=3114288 RepID=UPI0039C73FC3
MSVDGDKQHTVLRTANGGGVTTAPSLPLDSHQPEVPQEIPFYIPATGALTRARRTLKHDDAFAVLDSHGDIGISTDGVDGLFFEDTRYLSRLELRIFDEQLLLLGSNIRDDNAMLVVDLTNPDIFRDEQLMMPRETLHVVRSVFLWKGVAYVRFGVQNFSNHTIYADLSIDFSADFADLFEVRGVKRARRGVRLPTVIDNDSVTLNYRGLDNINHATTLRFDPAPAAVTENSVRYHLAVPGKDTVSLFLQIACNTPPDAPKRHFLSAMLSSHRATRAALTGGCIVSSSNELFNEVIGRAAADLAMLKTSEPEGSYPYAGIPWYSTTFGRDGLITAIEMLPFDPGMSRGVLQRLALFQSTQYDPIADAEPGKILHEMRGGEMARLGEVPFRQYYGSVDSTPLFVLLAGLYIERTGDKDFLQSIWPNIEAALAWIDGPGDADGDGFVEYQRATDRGLSNQGWKDSFDAVFHADGQLAEGAIALIEVQAYVFAAKQKAAHCARLLGLHARADALDQEARLLAKRVNDTFWLPDMGTYALALDGNKRPCSVQTSNAGHTLFAGIAPPERAEKIVSNLMKRSFFTGWGIRTVASGEARFNPMSYHNGSVWPHDNALIGIGLAQYGFKQELRHLFDAIFEAAIYMDLRRLPELYCGFRRRSRRGPTLYPVACSPQAWASGAPFAFLQSCLGLAFDPQRQEIRLYEPRLPAFLNELTLSNLTLGDDTVDLLIRRHQEEVSVQILNACGNIRVSIVHEGKCS